MTRRATLVLVLAAAVAGLVVAQVVNSPVTVNDCHSDFFPRQCMPRGTLVDGAVMGRWLVDWDVGWGDVILAATVASALMVAVSFRALRRG